MILQYGRKKKYQALGSDAPVFPNCHDKDLVRCLDELSTDKLCQILEQQNIYEVKSKAKYTACATTYPIN